MAAFCVFSLLLAEVLLMSLCIEVFMHFCCVFVFMSVFVFVFLITHSCWFPPFSSFQLPPRPGHCSTSWLKTTITARSFFSFTHILFACVSIQSIPEYKKISNLRHGLEKSNLILHSHLHSFFLQCFSIRILHSIFCDCSFQLNTYCIQFLCHL